MILFKRLVIKFNLDLSFYYKAYSRKLTELEFFHIANRIVILSLIIFLNPRMLFPLFPKGRLIAEHPYTDRRFPSTKT